MQALPTDTILVTRPMQWNAVPDGMETEALTETDRACMREIRDVLAKFDKLDKFGLNLIHKHFDIDDDECLVETIDVTNRTLVVQPRKKEAVSNAIETQWQLATGQAYVTCNLQCIVEAGSHSQRHWQQPDN